MKKPFIIFLISVILIGNFSPLLFETKKAQAQFTVIIAASTVAQMVQEQMAQQASGTFISKVVDQGLKILLETLRKKLLDYFVDSIIRWVQGVDGKPAFVTNWRKFMGDVVNDAVGTYIETTKFAGLCDTFDFQVRVSLTQPGRPALPTCTLNQIVGNIENFYSDFRSGGWMAYDEMLSPQNNPYGAYIIAEEGAVYEALTAQKEKEQEMSQNQGGFENTKRCAVEVTDPATQEKKCLMWESTTPGNVIAQRIQQALDVDIENVLSATEFTTYVAAIADAAINRLFRAGTDGLLGILTKEAPEKLGDSPTGINYECDTDIGACIMKVDGKFTSKEECDKDCAETSGVKWACDKNSKKCIISPYGNYNSEADCMDKCVLGGGDCNTEPELCSETNLYVRGQKCNSGNCAVVGPNNPNPSCCDVFCSHMKDVMYPKATAKHSWDWNDAEDNGIISAVCNYAGVPVASSCSCKINNMGGACFTGIPKTQCGNPLEGKYPEYDTGLLICKGEPPYCASLSFEEEVASCDDCTGMYVRGRIGGDNKNACPEEGCPRCSGTRYVDSRGGVCEAFCLHTKEFLWGTDELGQQKSFTKQEIIDKGYEELFTHLGKSIPINGCLCQRPITNSTFSDGYLCYDCKTVQGIGMDWAFSVCNGSAWCDANCSE